MVERQDSRYLWIVKAFGWYHTIVSFPLAWPVLSTYTLGILGHLHTQFSIPGTWLNDDASTLLFLNLFATLAMFWGIFRVRYASWVVVQYEGWAMLAFTLIVSWHVWQGASLLWLVIAVVDGVGAILHLVGSSFKLGSTQSAAP